MPSLGKWAVVDEESMSTEPNAAILAIGATMIDDLKPVDRFYVNVDLQSCLDVGLDQSESTRKWWSEQSAEAFNATQTNCVPIRQALQMWTDWINKHGGKEVRLMGNGPRADNQWLDSAFKACGMTNPVRYYNDIDHRTLNWLGAAWFNLDKKDVEFQGVQHHAGDDAEHEARHALMVLNRMHPDSYLSPTIEDTMNKQEFVLNQLAELVKRDGSAAEVTRMAEELSAAYDIASGGIELTHSSDIPEPKVYLSSPAPAHVTGPHEITVDWDKTTGIESAPTVTAGDDIPPAPVDPFPQAGSQVAPAFPEVGSLAMTSCTTCNTAYGAMLDTCPLCGTANPSPVPKQPGPFYWVHPESDSYGECATWQEMETMLSGDACCEHVYKAEYDKFVASVTQPDATPPVAEPQLDQSEPVQRDDWGLEWSEPWNTKTYTKTQFGVFRKRKGVNEEEYAHWLKDQVEAAQEAGTWTGPDDWMKAARIAKYFTDKPAPAAPEQVPDVPPAPVASSPAEPVTPVPVASQPSTPVGASAAADTPTAEAVQAVFMTTVKTFGAASPLNKAVLDHMGYMNLLLLPEDKRGEFIRLSEKLVEAADTVKANPAAVSQILS